MNTVVKLGISLLISVTLCLFGPLEILLTQAGEFHFDISGLFLPCFIEFLCVLALLFAFLSFVSLLGDGVKRVVFSFLTMLGLLLYIQGNWVFVRYGIMDGTPIDWGKYGVYGVINTILWVIPLCACPLLALLRRKCNMTFHVYASYIIVAMEILSLALVMVQKLPRLRELPTAKYYFTNEGRLCLSRNKDNFLVICADGFDGSKFLPALQAEPSLTGAFDGFTFFPDTAGTSLVSEESIITLLTGKQFHLMRSPFIDNIEKAYADSVFFKGLAKYNYTSWFFMDKSMMVDPKVISEAPNASEYVRGTYSPLIKQIWKMVLFRYMPHAMKKHFWYTSMDFRPQGKNSFKNGNFTLFSFLKNHGVPSHETEDNVYQFFWIQGPHLPATHDRYVRPISKSASASSTPEMQFEQLVGVVRLFSDLIQALKKAGVYDNTAIALVSDHGWDVRPNPLLLVKPRNSRGKMEVSLAPISMIEDWGPTFLSIISSGREGAGKTIFDVPPAKPRDRAVLVYDIQSGVDRRYLSHSAHYYPAGVFMKPDPCPAYIEPLGGGQVERVEYELGSPIFLPAHVGFSHVEGDSTWSNGNRSELLLKLKGHFDDLRLNLDYATFHGSQPVEIYANDFPIAVYEARGQQKRSFRIPGSCVGEGGELNIRFEFPAATRPSAVLENSMDGRKLALNFKSISLFAEDGRQAKCDLGTRLSFAGKDKSPARDFCIVGCSHPEKNYTWTVGTNVVMCFPSSDNNWQPSSITLHYRTFLPDEHVRISCGNAEIADYIAHGREKKTWAIPRDAASPAGLVVKIALPDAVSPRDLGEGKDRRRLALQLFSVTLQ